MEPADPCHGAVRVPREAGLFSGGRWIRPGHRVFASAGHRDPASAHEHRAGGGAQKPPEKDDHDGIGCDAPQYTGGDGCGRCLCGNAGRYVPDYRRGGHGTGAGHCDSEFPGGGHYLHAASRGGEKPGEGLCLRHAFRRGGTGGLHSHDPCGGTGRSGHAVSPLLRGRGHDVYSSNFMPSTNRTRAGSTGFPAWESKTA